MQTRKKDIKAFGDVGANLGATMLENGWPFGHNYANINIELPGVICVGLSSGRVSIDIPPTAPMIPTQPVYYVPVL